MGLDIGIINIEYLDRPQGIAYRFAWDLAAEASGWGYMAGEGNNWAPFSQRQVLSELALFKESRGLNDDQEREVLDWVRSLPWSGWLDELPPLPEPTTKGEEKEDEGYRPGPAILGVDDEMDGGTIELHFNW